LDLPPGKYAITLKKEGFVLSLDTVCITVNTTSTLDDSLLKNPKTSFRTVPNGARVFLDSVFIGRTPLDRLIIPVGMHSVKIELEDYQERSGIFIIEAGKDIIVSNVLVPAFGFSSISVSPADARVSIDNGSAITGGVDRKRLTVGWHTISVSHPAFSNSLTTKAYISPAHLTTFTADVDGFSIRALLYSIVLPGFGQICDGAIVKGSIELFGMAGDGYLLYRAIQIRDVKTTDFQNSCYNYDAAQS
jgi:hypothetical protein